MNEFRALNMSMNGELSNDLLSNIMDDNLQDLDIEIASMFDDESVC